MSDPTTTPAAAAPVAPAAPTLAERLEAHLDRVAKLQAEVGKDSPTVLTRYPVTAAVLAELDR